MADVLTHIYKYPRVLTDVPTHIIDVWNLNIGGGGDGPQTYWSTIAQAVRAGLGPSLFPIGTEFTINKTLDDVSYPITFVVRDHDHYQMTDSSIEHSMVLETKYVYGSSTEYKRITFDAQEALYYATNGLDAGSYCFTIKNQSWYQADNDVTFYFTLTKSVPVGGQLVVDATYNQSMEGKQLRSFADFNTTSYLELTTVSSTPITGAVNLGATDGNTTNVNFLPRIVFGSNNYLQSNVRQWLNSDKYVGSFYVPQTIFDRPGTFLVGTDPAYSGFAYGLDTDFISAVKPAVIPYRTNNVFETNSLDGTVQETGKLYDITTDKFFVLSRPEVFGTWDSTDIKDGTQLAGYVDMEAADRIKYDAFGNAYIDCGRSPNPAYGHSIRAIALDGSMYNGSASYLIGVTVACVIA